MGNRYIFIDEYPKVLNDSLYRNIFGGIKSKLNVADLIVHEIYGRNRRSVRESGGCKKH